MSTKEITKENFNKIIEDNNIVILDFWASWCGPCRAFSPVFEELSEEDDTVVFGKVNTEEQEELSYSFNIRSIPTIAVIKNKQLIFAQPGMLPKNTLKELINKVKELDIKKD